MELFALKKTSAPGLKQPNFVREFQMDNFQKSFLGQNSFVQQIGTKSFDLMTVCKLQWVNIVRLRDAHTLLPKENDC